MGIKFDEYIECLTRHFYSHLNVADGYALKTSRITDANRLASIAADLPLIDWVGNGVIYRTETSFLIKLSINDDRFYAMLTMGHESRLAVNSIAEELGLKSREYDDAFFLFCVKKMNLQPRRDFDPAALRATLTCKEGKKVCLIDYDIARRSFGEFYVWQITSIYAREHELLPYLLSIDNKCKLAITNTFENRFDLEAASFGSCVDFARIAESATRSIFEVMGVQSPKVRVLLQESETLVPALENLKLIKEEVIFRSGGGVFFRFIRDGKPHLGISISPIIDPRELADYLDTLSIVVVDYNDAEFLSLAYQLSGALPICSEYFLTSEATRLMLDSFEIIDSVYQIDIAGVKNFFDSVSIFDISNSSLPGIWDILLKLASNFRALSSPYISNDLRDLAKVLSDIQGVTAENLYLALTASHWKHSFLESFRLIESLYYFGWMNKLKVSLGSTVSEFKLAQQCKTEISWKVKELPSIQNLFSLIPDNVINKDYLAKITCISESLSNTSTQVELMRAFGAAVYSIRNSGVHQGAHETEKKIIVTSLCWAPLTEAILKIIQYFYSDESHKNGMPQEHENFTLPI